MNKLFFLPAILILTTLSLFSLDAGSPAEEVRQPPTQHYCRAINNQLTMELIQQVVVDNKLTFQKQLFEPILLGRDPGGRVILVGKKPDSDRIIRIPVRYIKDSTVLETKNFLVTQQMRDHAAGMVHEVICGP